MIPLYTDKDALKRCVRYCPYLGYWAFCMYENPMAGVQEVNPVPYLVVNRKGPMLGRARAVDWEDPKALQGRSNPCRSWASSRRGGAQKQDAHLQRRHSSGCCPGGQPYHQFRSARTKSKGFGARSSSRRKWRRPGRDRLRHPGANRGFHR
jgi:hypothetical protein